MKECRILEISQDGRTLAVERGFVVIKEKGEELGRVELDTLAGIICSSNWSMLGTPTINKLAEYNIPLVVCDKRTKVPSSALISLDANWRQGDVLEAQARCTIPKNKSAWQTIIKAKLAQQAQTLKFFGKDVGYEILSNLATKVKSGDPENIEGRGAAIYWRELMGKSFRRNREAEDENILFNYGYTILRACTIRAICVAGMHPSLGIHHRSATNTHRLSDDLIEPFRCFVDLRVKEISQDGDIRLTAENRKRLSSVLLDRYFRKDCITTVAQMITDTAIGLAKYYLDENKNFSIDIVKASHLKRIILNGD